MLLSSGSQPIPASGSSADASSIGNAIAAGDNHTCAIMKTDSLFFDTGLFCWGDNQAGQLGDGTKKVRLTPIEVGLGSVRSVAAGSQHTCAVGEAGDCTTVPLLGANNYGQLGLGDQVARTLPVRVDLRSRGFSGRLSVAAGGDSTCVAYTYTGLGFGGPSDRWACWGRNDSGQLGDGTTGGRTAPGDSPQPVVQLSLGSRHGCARGDTDGIEVDFPMHCWGANDTGQVGDGTTTGRFVPELLYWECRTVGPGLQRVAHICLYLL